MEIIGYRSSKGCARCSRMPQDDKDKPGFFSRLFGRGPAPSQGDASRPDTAGPVELGSAEPAAGDMAELAIPIEALDPLRQAESFESVPPPEMLSGLAAEAAREPRSWWQRLKQGLARSSTTLGQGISDIFT